MINVYDSMAKGIDKIASNIHAISLNASIEAARAGEHGKSLRWWPRPYAQAKQPKPKRLQPK